ncbi:methionyl-tRNA formyltransferase [bacterium]|nr:MAG: methionyl-tRNA formyltransferase [bacterium]
MIRTIFFGTPLFSKNILTYLLEQREIEIASIVTKLPKGKPDKKNNAVYDFAKLSQIPYLTPYKFNNEFEDKLRQIDPDLIIVASYGKILPKWIIDYPKLGSLNVHGSLLPTLRGATPIESAILSGLQKTGLTLQKMSVELDEGDIIGQVELAESLDNINATELYAKLSNLSIHLLDEFLLSYLNGEVTPFKQANLTDIQPTYCYTSDFSFEKAELHFDYKIELDRKIRAFSEIGTWVKNIEIVDVQSGEKTFLTNLVKINSCKSDSTQLSLLCITNEKLEEKLKLSIIKDRLFLSCRDGVLEVLEITPEGKPKQKAKDFINGVWNRLR